MASIKSDPEIVLFSVLGTSPAILTETVWALAHEEIPTVPDRVIVATTSVGRQKVKDALLKVEDESGHLSVWDDLRFALERKGIDVDGKLRFGSTGEDIRVCTGIDPSNGRSRELDDIRSALENECMANFILEILRGLVENSGVDVIGSVAGGRKTMGSLLYGAMSLIARSTDRLTHVLVSEPFDSPRLNPGFYFPDQRNQCLVHDAQRVRAGDARVELADVPFVPLRNLFQRELGETASSFSQLVSRYRRGVRTETMKLWIRLASAEPYIEINGTRLRLPAREHILMHLLAARLKANLPPLERYAAAFDDFRELCDEFHKKAPLGNFADWRHEARLPQNYGPDDIRRTVSHLRKRVRGAGLAGQHLAARLPKDRCFGLELEPERVEVVL